MWAYQGEGWDGKTHSNHSQKSYGWLPSLPKWFRIKSNYTLEAQRYGCTSPMTGGTWDLNPTCFLRWRWELRNRWCATQLFVWIYSASQRSIVAKDGMRDTEFIPDLLTHNIIFTGLYTISFVILQLTTIWKMWAAFWENLTANTGVEWSKQDVSVFLLSTICGHFIVYFKGFIYMHH